MKTQPYSKREWETVRRERRHLKSDRLVATIEMLNELNALGVRWETAEERAARERAEVRR